MTKPRKITISLILLVLSIMPIPFSRIQTGIGAGVAAYCFGWLAAMGKYSVAEIA